MGHKNGIGTPRLDKKKKKKKKKKGQAQAINV